MGHWHDREVKRQAKRAKITADDSKAAAKLLNEQIKNLDPRESAPKGLRFNKGKLRYELESPIAREGLVKVFTFGATKYEAHNWTKGLNWDDTIACLERHLAALKMGEEIDSDSGLPHIDHVQWNAHALSHFQKTQTGNDDRYFVKYRKGATGTCTKCKGMAPLNGGGLCRKCFGV